MFFAVPGFEVQVGDHSYSCHTHFHNTNCALHGSGALWFEQILNVLPHNNYCNYCDRKYQIIRKIQLLYLFENVLMKLCQSWFANFFTKVDTQ